MSGDKALTWNQVKVTAAEMGMSLAAQYIELGLQQLGKTEDITWEDVKAVSDLLGIECAVVALEGAALLNISMETIVYSNLTIAEKIRRLTTLGLDRTRIADILKIRYQMVRNVQERTA